MAKTPTITDITSGFASATATNANNDAIVAAFENTVSRDGSTPNTMEADLDLNGNNLLNVGLLNGLSVEASVGAVETAKVQAENAAAQAVAVVGFDPLLVPDFDAVNRAMEKLYLHEARVRQYNEPKFYSLSEDYPLVLGSPDWSSTAYVPVAGTYEIDCSYMPIGMEFSVATNYVASAVARFVISEDQAFTGLVGRMADVGPGCFATVKRLNTGVFTISSVFANPVQDSFTSSTLTKAFRRVDGLWDYTREYSIAPGATTVHTLPSAFTGADDTLCKVTTSHFNETAAGSGRTILARGTATNQITVDASSVTSADLVISGTKVFDGTGGGTNVLIRAEGLIKDAITDPPLAAVSGDPVARDFVLLGAGQSNIDFPMRGDLVKGFTDQGAVRRTAATAKCEFIDGAFGGSSILASLGTSGNNWYNEATLGDGPRLTEAKVTIAAAISRGLAFDAISWAQGEQDAAGLTQSGATTSKARYLEGLTYVADELMTAASCDKFIIVGIGANDGADRPGLDMVREAQQSLAASDSRVSVAIDTYDLSRPPNDVHLDLFAQNTMGARLWDAFDNLVNAASNYEGPTVSSVTHSADGLEHYVTITGNGETVTYPDFIEGFGVLTGGDDMELAEIESWARVGDVITLRTTTAVPSAKVIFPARNADMARRGNIISAGDDAKPLRTFHEV